MRIRNKPLISEGSAAKYSQWSAACADAMRSVRRCTSEDISAKAPTTGASTLPKPLTSGVFESSRQKQTTTGEGFEYNYGIRLVSAVWLRVFDVALYIRRNDSLHDLQLGVTCIECIECAA